MIDALEAAVGPDGTLLVGLGALDGWAWVNERPERQRPGLLRDADPFDCLVTPADPEMGVLPEVFRTRPRTKVSDHPEGRFAASGALADRLLDDVPWDDYYGPGSPLERLVEAGGRVLRLGADLDTVTLIHYAEYLAPVASKRRVRRHRLVAGRERPEIRVVECLDDSDGIVDYPGEDYFAVILREYLATGRASTGFVGTRRERAHRRGRRGRVRRVVDGRTLRHLVDVGCKRPLIDVAVLDTVRGWRSPITGVPSSPMTR